MKIGVLSARGILRNNMVVEITVEADIDFDFDSSEKIIKAAVSAVYNKFNIPNDLDVNVLITTEEAIKEINREFRNIDSATDVLSFPYFEFDKPGKFMHNVSGGENILGDIVICAPEILKQADEYGHSIKRELAFLTVHSMLHLLGFDHETEEEANLMENEQRKIMEFLKIPR